MPKVNFPKKWMTEMTWEGGWWDDNDIQILEKVSDEIYDTTRWSILHLMIFKDLRDGKHYSVTYSVGATEYQSEGPFDYDGNEIKCTEVHQVEKVVKVWEKV